MFSESANFRMIGFCRFLLQLGCSTIRIRTNLENHVRIAIIPVTTGHSVGATNRTLVVSMHMDQAYLMTAKKALLLHMAKVIYLTPLAKQKFHTTVQNISSNNNEGRIPLYPAFVMHYFLITTTSSSLLCLNCTSKRSL